MSHTACREPPLHTPASERLFSHGASSLGSRLSPAAWSTPALKCTTDISTQTQQNSVHHQLPSFASAVYPQRLCTPLGSCPGVRFHPNSPAHTLQAGEGAGPAAPSLQPAGSLSAHGLFSVITLCSLGPAPGPGFRPRPRDVSSRHESLSDPGKSSVTGVAAEVPAARQQLQSAPGHRGDPLPPLAGALLFRQTPARSCPGTAAGAGLQRTKQVPGCPQGSRPPCRPLRASAERPPWPSSPPCRHRLPSWLLAPTLRHRTTH